MARISLKNILSEKTESFALISSLLEKLNADVFILDNSQKVLSGVVTADPVYQEPLKLDDEIIGWVKGDDKVPVISSLVNLLIQKESEKKKIGSEVLMLYQEVNMIFNFSDKLAQTIGQQSIAEITLDEAARLIKSESGIILLWDEENHQFNILASTGQSLFDQEKLTSEVDMLVHITHSGQSDIVGDLSPLKAAGLVMPEVQSLVYAALKVKHRVMGAIILARTTPLLYSAADLKFLITLALQSSSSIESALLYEKNIREAKEREEAMRRIYDVTNKFVPHEFIRSLGRSVITDIQLGDQVEKIVTVLFSDIRDYTTLAERMTPEENFRFVCSFNERIGPIIREHHGFINQYLGDAIMAIFPRSASDALTAAVEMQKAVDELNNSRVLKTNIPIRIGVGMHTGPLIMGITGDHERLDATTIADTVNTASRLEGLTKHYKVNILLSDSCVDNLMEEGAFHLRHLGRVQLKGKQEATRIYECFNSADEFEIQKKLKALPLFKQGMDHYFSKSFHEASIKFNQVLEIDADDVTTKLFLSKVNRHIDAGIPENWTGVEEMLSK
ncbi:MAG TPA: adenylate/guanylate cyclase domain-containing protein [Puia sp.]|nr:adenylate/guanylate cyclase domain-containing protein [Puia sp.]